VRSGLIAVLFIAAAQLAPCAAAADTWVPLPGGGWGVPLDYSTSGVFSCTANAPISGGCTALGNSVVLTNGSASMMLTFVGATQSTVAGESQLVSLGTFERTFFGSEPFTMPTARDLEYGMIHLEAELTTNFGSRTFGVDLIEPERSRGTLDMREGPAFLVFGGIGPYPEGVRANMSLIFDNVGNGKVPLHSASTPWLVPVSVVPEPSTSALLGSGLLVLGGTALRQRHEAAKTRRRS